MGTINTTIKIDANARAAVSGLKPLNTALEKTKDEAQDAEHALKDLGNKHKIKIDDDAVDRARREIRRLREQIRDDLKVDINADTRLAQRRIRQLQSSIRSIDEHKKVEVNVDVDRSGMALLGQLKGGIGRLGPVAGAIKTALGVATLGLSSVAIAGATAVGWTLQMADQMANARIAFEQFLGTAPKADKFLGNLQEFAKATPFEFPELVESSKQLLAFGINADDIVPILTSLGDAAALTGSNVSDLTAIWGQMQAKGKVANEELLQLTERGIPAYQILADAMGLTVGEVQKMASEGKLLSSNVLPTLQAGLNDTFGGGMAKQARTLGGLFSTLQDTIGGIGTKLGEAFTPVVAEQLDTLIAALEGWSDWVSENKERVVVAFSEMAASVLDFAADIAMAFSGIIEAGADLLGTFASMEKIIKYLSPAAAVMFRNTDFGKASDDLHDVADGLGNVSDGLHSSARDAVATGTKWSKAFAESDAIQKTKNDVSDLKDEIKELGKQPRSPEIDAKTEAAKKKLRDLRAELKRTQETKVATRIDANISNSQKKLRDWRASLAYLRTLKPTTKVNADIAAAKAKIRELRGSIKEAIRKRVAPIDVKITGAKDKAKRLKTQLAELGKKKSTPEVQAKTAEAKKRLAGVQGQIKRLKGQKASILVRIRANAKPAKDAIDAIAERKRKAAIGVVAPRAAGVSKTLNNVAKPGGGDRKAPITAEVQGASAASLTLDNLAKDRYSTIHVTTVRTGGGGGGGASPGTQSIVPQLLGGPALRAAGRAVTSPVTMGATPAGQSAQGGRVQSSGGNTYQIAPRSTPVKVFIDGQEVASRVESRIGARYAGQIQRRSA